MAPQAAAALTSPIASTTASTTAATTAPLAPPDDSGDRGLSQGQIGGILVGVVAFVALLLVAWYYVTRSDGYTAYREERHYRERLRRLRTRERRRRSFYEAEVRYETDSETTEVSASARQRFEAARMQQMMMAEAAMMAAQEEEAERQRRAAGVATTPEYVLNTPPVRFPPTARRASYVQTRHAQIPGARVRRFP
ncbi:hypothetical protein Sste5346_008328 [Sporothrix stenoceras]|uniref:Transmembrane protein n=1 Tax=Sporothrix stenoceras TaxID=5173 RepID=A0ABR3YPT8_9PEZI